MILLGYGRKLQFMIGPGHGEAVPRKLFVARLA